MDLRALYGTDAAPAPWRMLTAGAASVALDGGNLRHLRVGDCELIRGVAFLVRDRDWGTLSPAIRDMQVVEGAETRIRYAATYRVGDARLAVDLAITLTPQSLRFDAGARASGDFETNRTGFVVLHPIDGVAGSPVRVTHGSAPAEDARFPALIAPWQPFQDITALTHVTGGLRVACQFEGDVFEMEDQRQWGDASFKTYVRPLARPWPYRIADGCVMRQTVQIDWQPCDTGAPVEPVRCVVKDARFPETALLVRATDAGRPDAPALLRQIGPQRLLCHFDATAGHGLAELAAFAGLQRALPDLAFDLELIALCPPDGDLAAEFAGYADLVAQAGLRTASVMVCPAVDRQSTPPGSDWPPCPNLTDIHAAAARAFPGQVMGGGMASLFTELNRKRPPVAQLDFITHGFCPIVHDADDRAVIETLQTVPHILASGRAIVAGQDGRGGCAYRLGPSTIAMRQNPYGSRTIANPQRGRVCMTDDDPRQDGAFAAAWTLGLAAMLAPAGLQVWTPAELCGPRGLFDADGRARPLAAVVAHLARCAGQRVAAGAGIASGLARLTCGDTSLVANMTPAPLTRADLSKGLAAPLPPFGWRILTAEDLQASPQGIMA